MATRKEKKLQERVDEKTPIAMENVRRKVALRLAILGKSRAELCKEHNVSTSAISNILNSDNTTIRSLLQISEMLGVTPSWLLSPIEDEGGSE